MFEPGPLVAHLFLTRLPTYPLTRFLNRLLHSVHHCLQLIRLARGGKAGDPALRFPGKRAEIEEAVRSSRPCQAMQSNLEGIDGITMAGPEARNIGAKLLPTGRHRGQILELEGLERALHRIGHGAAVRRWRARCAAATNAGAVLQ